MKQKRNSKLTTRRDWHSFFMSLATSYSLQSTCPRAHVGCVMVHGTRQIGAGFNGAASGDEHCTETEDCAIDGHCERSIHAEVNAVLQALQLAPDKVHGCTAYVTHYPCIHCYKILVQVGVGRIIYKNKYGNTDAVNRMRARYIDNNPELIWFKDL